jgi:polyhydroxybutyrate depolymerase
MMSKSADHHVGSRLHRFARRIIKGGIQSRAGRTAMTAVVLVSVPWMATGCARKAMAEGEPASTCVSSLAGGWQTVSIDFEGQSYAVDVFSPVQVPEGQQRAVILDLHASNSNGSAQARISDLDRIAARADAVLVNPTGSIRMPDRTPPLAGGSWTWHVPGVPAFGGVAIPPDTRDDIGFLSEVITATKNRACIDPQQRVYATGYSGGARMASALACAIPQNIAAIAPVAGLRAGRADPHDLDILDITSCTPEKPVSVLAFHGTADGINPYDGNTDARWGYSIPAALQRWAVTDKCDSNPTDQRISTTVALLEYAGCADGAKVALYRVTGGGHTWPGSPISPCSQCGMQTADINASDLLLDFIKQGSRAASN